LFLGTGLGAEVVQRDLELPECDWIRIVPSFASAELPELLAAAAVGAFPSYIEGFPFGVLEKLAAGLPVAAYDVPGPREMLKELPNQLLTPLGDTESLGAKVSSLLKLPLAEYARLSKDCEILANKYRWLDVAERTLQTYEEALAKLETR
jgi:glycosyltransferase involved in cell wall biosynthesis